MEETPLNFNDLPSDILRDIAHRDVRDLMGDEDMGEEDMTTRLNEAGYSLRLRIAMATRDPKVLNRDDLNSFIVRIKMAFTMRDSSFLDPKDLEWLRQVYDTALKQAFDHGFDSIVKFVDENYLSARSEKFDLPLRFYSLLQVKIREMRENDMEDFIENPGTKLVYNPRSFPIRTPQMRFAYKKRECESKMRQWNYRKELTKMLMTEYKNCKSILDQMMESMKSFIRGKQTFKSLEEPLNLNDLPSDVLREEIASKDEKSSFHGRLKLFTSTRDVNILNTQDLDHLLVRIKAALLKRDEKYLQPNDYNALRELYGMCLSTVTREYISNIFHHKEILAKHTDINLSEDSCLRMPFNTTLMKEFRKWFDEYRMEMYDVYAYNNDEYAVTERYLYANENDLWAVYNTYSHTYETSRLETLTTLQRLEDLLGQYKNFLPVFDEMMKKVERYITKKDQEFVVKTPEKGGVHKWSWGFLW